MRLALGVLYYNSKEELTRLLGSIPAKAVDVIIAVDGIFQYVKDTNPDMPTLSNDGSTELLRGAAHNIKILNCGNQPEYVKRNRYLEYAEKQGDIDYLIIVDSDEYFHYDSLDCSCMRKRVKLWGRFKQAFEREVQKHGGGKNVFTMSMFNPTTKKIVQRPRCWYKPGDMRYVFGSHYHWANMKTEQFEIEKAKIERVAYTQYSAGDIQNDELLLINDGASVRTIEQENRREKYQQYLRTYEALRQADLRMEHEQAHAMATLSPAATVKSKYI